MSRNDGLNVGAIFRNLILRGLLKVVCEIHAFHIDGFVGGIIKLNPVAFLEIFVYKTVVWAAYLIDANGSNPLFLFASCTQLIECGCEFDVTIGQGNVRTTRIVGAIIFYPCLERITCRSCCIDDRRVEELSVKRTCGQFNAIDGDDSPFQLRFQSYTAWSSII